MIRRLFVCSVILVCCGCSAASTNTEVASTKWRMENLEQRFLDFREKAALREAGLSSRITKLEKQLGLPVPKQDGMLASSTQLTPDVHVFVSPINSNDEKKSATVNNNTLIPANMKSSGEKNTDKANLSSTVQKSPVSKTASSVSQEKASAKKVLKKSVGSATHPSKSSVTSGSSSATSSLKPVAKVVPPVEQKTSAPSVKNITESVAKPVATSVSNKHTTAPRLVTQPSSPSPNKAVVARTKKTGSTSMYKNGLQLLEKGRYVEGRESLEEFLTEFPHDPLVPNAVYWVGESFYSQKDYLIAVDLFREVLRRFPDSNKARAAMLKIGYSYERLGEMSEARRSLLKVVEKYPKSNEARLARKKLSGV